MNKSNTYLILGLSLPILMVMVIAAIIYIPGFSAHPKFNFLYSLDRQYSSEGYYVQNGQIAIQKNAQSTRQDAKPAAPSQLFVYDMTANRSQAISFEKAQQLKLEPNPISPDGYQIRNGSSADGFLPLLLIVSDPAGIYLSGHNANQKLNIGTYQNSYWGFHFIGWLIP